MEFKYPTQYDEEAPAIENKVLPILTDREHSDIRVACESLANGDKQRALDYLRDMLSSLGCTCEKDSFCEYIEGIIKVAYAFDTRKDEMIEDLNYVIYQMF